MTLLEPPTDKNKRLPSRTLSQRTVVQIGLGTVCGFVATAMAWFFCRLAACEDSQAITATEIQVIKTQQQADRDRQDERHAALLMQLQAISAQLAEIQRDMRVR